MTVFVPTRLVSEANTREHWAVRQKRKKAQQRAVKLAFLAGRHRLPAPPVEVTLTRVGLRKLDPDNLAGSFKHVQDEVARLIGVDDGDERAVRWGYRQRSGSSRYSLEITIAPAAAHEEAA